MSTDWKVYCCELLSRHKRRIYAQLRLISDYLIAANPSLSMRIGDRACCNCLNATRKLPLKTTTCEQEQEQACSSSQPSPSVPADEAIQSKPSEPTPADTEDSGAYSDDMLPADATLSDVNEVLGIVRISLFSRKQQVWNQTYVGVKLQRVGDVLKKKLLFAVRHEERKTQDDGREMIKQLK